MDLTKMIVELRSERAAIEEAMVVLERLASTHVRRRGRPPAWLALVRGSAPEPGERKTRVLSAAVRKRMAESQKKRWAAVRKAQAASSK